MDKFEELYKGLNAAQKQAVDTIDGPVLVIAGPGTGKTQLLSARVAHILEATDTPPQNILCLTFTENGAQNMRDRLSQFIGQAAYDVTISTYHAFGGDIIRRFPEYFTELRLENPVDDLGKRQILTEIIDTLHFENPLKQTRHHIGDLMATVSELKRALLDASTITHVAQENQLFIEAASKRVTTILAAVDKMPGTFTKAAPYFVSILSALRELTPSAPANVTYGSLGAVAQIELAEALQSAESINKSTPLTAWKNKWLAKNADNNFVLAGELENRRLAALAPVLEAYQTKLSEQGLYDFDDMILRAIQVLEQNVALKFSLQEQYLYILLDEYQDTNAAQARLVQLLTDNPVNEGRPNVMAVGDDDQAIYAFQGAEYSNMAEFFSGYRDTVVINLTENYRSTRGILATSEAVARQIKGRLTDHFPSMTKQLVAANKKLPNEIIERVSYNSDIAAFAGLADQIKQLIGSGVKPQEIAVLAPKHRQLEVLVPYLNAAGVPVSYEKRENILEAPVVRQIITMSRLALAIAAGADETANMLWPQVLSYQFWGISTATIWQLSWRVSDSHGKLNWSQALLEEPSCQEAILLLLSIAGKVSTESCETILDDLIGNEIVETNDANTPRVTSPLREHYIGADQQTSQPELFYDTISHLIVLRAKLRAYQHTQQDVLLLADLLRFIGLYEAADQQILDTSPHKQASESVQLMTVFKAKGLEFEHVFLPSCHNDVWGSSSRGNSNKLTLPANLQAIRHAGANDDERLRILFVALTRARFGLHLISYDQDYAGKSTQRLKYFDEQPDHNGVYKSQILPENTRYVASKPQAIPKLTALELDWHSRHFAGPNISDLKALLQVRLENYQLSPTHLTTFIDMEYGGPKSFFLRTLLRFPSAPTIDSEFGTVIHETLEWFQHQISNSNEVPSQAAVIRQFTGLVSTRRLPDHERKVMLERGDRALNAYIKARGKHFDPAMVPEKNFRNENVFIGNIHLGGKIDSLEIDQRARTITVVDYKTGKSYNRWQADAKLHRYQLQLYCYKLLVENSRTYKGYTVKSGRLEFVEPDDEGKIHSLELYFDEDGVQHTKKLLQAMWRKVTQLEIPDTSGYAENLTGIRAFEQDLLDGSV